MKKILFGLAAMSTLAFSAIDLGNPTDGTNTWMTGEAGAIAVTGTITSAVPQVQYVVFASTTGTYDGTGETLDLADFVISRKAVENVFSAENPKVYVKRVNGDQNGTEELLDTDVVKFKVDVEKTRTAYSTAYFGVNGGVTYEALALLDDATADELLNSIKDAMSGAYNLSFDKATGQFKGNLTYAYRVPNGIKFASSTNGVLEVTASKSSYASGDASEGQAPYIEAALSGGKPVSSTLRILVTVNA